MDSNQYNATLEVDYPVKLDRVTTFFRIIWIIPIAIIVGLVTASSDSYIWVVSEETGETIEWISTSSGGVLGGLMVATVLMIVFRQKYPRWWFDFAKELTRFITRVSAYGALLTDQYPSTDEEQAIHLDVVYPDAEHDLNRWLPLVKWFLAIPHYFVLVFLYIGALFAVIIAWFAILFTGRYPHGLFDYVVGVGRWSLRVYAYGFLLVTDRYPPFSLS